MNNQYSRTTENNRLCIFYEHKIAQGLFLMRRFLGCAILQTVEEKLAVHPKSMTSWLGLIDPTTGSFHGFRNQGHRVYVFNAAQCMCLVGVGCLFADASNVTCRGDTRTH